MSSGVQQNNRKYHFSGASRFLQQKLSHHQIPGWYHFLICLCLYEVRREGNSGTVTRLHDNLPLCLFASREKALKSKCKQSEGHSQQKRERLRTVTDHEKTQSLTLPGDLACFPCIIVSSSIFPSPKSPIMPSSKVTKQSFSI